MKKSDLWKQLVEEAVEEEIERAASVTVAEAEAELTAAGFDVAAERAKAEAFLHELENPEPAIHDAPLTAAATAVVVAPEKARRSIPPDRRRGPSPMLVLLGTAVVAAAAGAAIYAATHPTPEPIAPLPPPTTTSPTVVPSVPSPDPVKAAELRRLAGAHCVAQQWDECLAYLEDAREADPAGDDSPAVKRLRDEAIAAIHRKPKRLPP